MAKLPSITVEGLPFEWEVAIIRALVVRLGGSVHITTDEMKINNVEHGLIIAPDREGNIEITL